TPIRMSLAPGPGQWARIVKGFWNSLPLFAQNPEGPTKDEIKWLRDRSGAHMGTLASIIGQSVNMLINAGEPAAETLSIESMEAARLDLRAEQLVRLRSQQETSRSVNKSRKPKVAYTATRFAGSRAALAPCSRNPPARCTNQGSDQESSGNTRRGAHAHRGAGWACPR